MLPLAVHALVQPPNHQCRELGAKSLVAQLHLAGMMLQLEVAGNPGFMLNPPLIHLRL
jgi:hypothetical protein